MCVYIYIYIYISIIRFIQDLSDLHEKNMLLEASSADITREKYKLETNFRSLVCLIIFVYSSKK